METIFLPEIIATLFFYVLIGAVIWPLLMAEWVSNLLPSGGGLLMPIGIAALLAFLYAVFWPILLYVAASCWIATERGH
ncbi:hypothetical protein fHeYen801_088 [Yersinia phage fHe-Yen8-01]|nr:hypothetical protein fHeYen801_088 [Yersinia phage fHe-Yen8-01]